jgi:hypothetical protein
LAKLERLKNAFRQLRSVCGRFPPTKIVCLLPHQSLQSFIEQQEFFASREIMPQERFQGLGRILSAQINQRRHKLRINKPISQNVYF